MIMRDLTVLSFGGGQDSTALLMLLIYSPEFRAKYVKGELIVIMADTGNEHPYTYDHVEHTKKLCKDHGIPFFFITEAMGFHRPSWPNLITPQLRSDSDKYQATMVQSGTKSCTLQLKVDPIYKFVDEYLNGQYQMGFKRHSGRGCAKQAIKKFQKAGNKIHVMIGFAFGEESRAEKSIKLQASEQKTPGKWQQVLNRIFPLIDLKMDRKACADLCEEKLGYEVMPSNCMLCPYQSPAELLWLARNYPRMWETWVTIEANKIERNKHLEGTMVTNKRTGKEKPFKNQGVYCTPKLLPARLIEAQAKFGHLSQAELHEYKKFHGCATNAM